MLAAKGAVDAHRHPSDLIGQFHQLCTPLKTLLVHARTSCSGQFQRFDKGANRHATQGGDGGYHSRQHGVPHNPGV